MVHSTVSLYFTVRPNFAMASIDNCHSMGRAHLPCFRGVFTLEMHHFVTFTTIKKFTMLIPWLVNFKMCWHVYDLLTVDLRWDTDSRDIVVCFVVATVVHLVWGMLGSTNAGIGLIFHGRHQDGRLF